LVDSRPVGGEYRDLIAEGRAGRIEGDRVAGLDDDTQV